MQDIIEMHIKGKIAKYFALLNVSLHWLNNFSKLSQITYCHQSIIDYNQTPPSSPLITANVFVTS